MNQQARWEATASNWEGIIGERDRSAVCINVQCSLLAGDTLEVRAYSGISMAGCSQSWK